MSIDTLDSLPAPPRDLPNPAVSDPTPTENNDYVGDADRMLNNERPLDNPHDKRTDQIETSQGIRSGETGTQSLQNEKNHLDTDDLPRSPIDLGDKTPTGDKPASRDNDGDVDQMLNNEQPLDYLYGNKTDQGTRSDDDRETKPQENQQSPTGTDDFSQPPIGIDEKSPSDHQSLSHNGDGDISDADRMLNNERPLEGFPDETHNSVNWQPTQESSTEGRSEAKPEGYTYHDTADAHQAATADPSLPNNDESGNPDHILTEEQQQQPVSNNDATIRSNPETPETTSENNSNPAASTESRNNPGRQSNDPLSTADEHATRNWEDTDRVGQDSKLGHFANQQPNEPSPDKQLTENSATGTIRAGADFPLISVGQLDEKLVSANANREGNEFSSAAQQATANTHSHLADLPTQPNIIDDLLRGLSLQPVHGLDLEPSGQHGIGMFRPDQGAPDAPPGYEIAPQTTPEFPQPGDPIVTEKPSGGTPITGNDNPDGGHEVSNKNLRPEDLSHNTDGNPTPRLVSASTTETNNDSNGNEHVAHGVTGAAENVTHHANGETENAANNVMRGSSGKAGEGMAATEAREPATVSGRGGGGRGSGGKPPPGGGRRPPPGADGPEPWNEDGDDSDPSADGTPEFKIPSGAKKPTSAYPEIMRKSGLSRDQLSNAFHRVKYAAGLPGNASTRIDGEGNVYIKDTGEWIGNVIDESRSR